MSVNKSQLVKSILDKANYTPVPNEIWILDIPTRAKITYLYIIGQSDKWHPGVRTIAKATGQNKNTIARALKDLQDANMLIIESNGKGMRDTYILTGLNVWDVGQVSLQQDTPVPSGDTSVPSVTHHCTTEGTHPRRTQYKSKTKPKTKGRDEKSKENEEIERITLQSLEEEDMSVSLDEIDNSTYNPSTSLLNTCEAAGIGLDCEPGDW